MILDIQFAELQRITILKEEQEKSVNITENGTTEITPDKGKALSMVTVNVDVPDTSEEIGKTIDESGVLDSTEGTATEKVEQLIDKAQWEKLLYEQSGKWTENFKSMFNQFNGKKLPRLNFENATNLQTLCYASAIETVDYYINSPKTGTAYGMFGVCKNLKFLTGVDISNVTTVQDMFFNNFALEEIQEPLNFTKVTKTNGCFTGVNALREIRFVPETIKVSIVIGSEALSDESIISIVNGLATVTVTQDLTLHSDISWKIYDMEGLYDIMAERNWNII